MYTYYRMKNELFPPLFICSCFSSLGLFRCNCPNIGEMRSEGVSTSSSSSSSEQQINNISPSSRTNPIVGRTLSEIEQREGISTSPPPSEQQTNNTSPSSSSQPRQNPIVANAATPQQSGSSNPLGLVTESRVIRVLYRVICCR